jgi:anti-sigma regulatory factor (Ser/Thr protein kinase)
MIDSVPADVANAECFARVGLAADPHSAAHTREEFSRWLAQYFALDAARANDIVLATNEALANAAEFAYLTADGPGTMDLLATYDAEAKRLAVTVSDRGSWRPPDPAPKDRLRGRGIPLMHALSDHAAIEPTTHGTQVHMTWAGVSASPDVSAR